MHSGATAKGVPLYSSKLLLLSSKNLTLPSPVKLTLSSLSIMIFCAFKSRCRTPLSCIIPSATQTCVSHLTTVGSPNPCPPFCSFILSLSLVPLIYSYTKIKCLSSKKWSTSFGKWSSPLMSLHIWTSR